MDAAGNPRRVEFVRCACLEWACLEEKGPKANRTVRCIRWPASPSLMEQERRSRQQLQDWLARHPRARVIVSHDLPESRLAQP